MTNDLETRIEIHNRLRAAGPAGVNAPATISYDDAVKAGWWFIDSRWQPYTGDPATDQDTVTARKRTGGGIIEKHFEKIPGSDRWGYRSPMSRLLTSIAEHEARGAT